MSALLVGPADTGRYTTRILRVFARFVSVGYVAYLVVTMAPMTVFAPHTEPGWTFVVALAVFGSGILPGLLSFRADLRPMQRAATAAAVIYLAALASWFVAWDRVVLTSTDSVWLTAFPGVASMMALVAWRVRLVFAHLLIGCGTTSAMNIMLRGASWWTLIAESALSVTFCSLYVGATAMALRTGRILDETTESTHRAAAKAAARASRTIERERFDALVHDHVMSTLLVASRADAQDVPTLAAATLAELDGLREGADRDHPFSRDEMVVHLRTAAAAVDERTDFTVRRGDDADASTADIDLRLPASEPVFPADVVRAMGAALAEALRNSRLHAGPTASRIVEVATDGAGVKVTVDDDGKGFDRTAVPRHRLGVAVSIVGRMNHIPGGHADVHSVPGEGTRVTIGWRP